MLSLDRCYTAVGVTEFVGKYDVALVVLGSRTIGLNRFLRGSTSEEVFRSVACPVLTVGPRAKSPRSPVGISAPFLPQVTSASSRSRGAGPKLTVGNAFMLKRFLQQKVP
jgi:hypothetical protein